MYTYKFDTVEADGAAMESHAQKRASEGWRLIDVHHAQGLHGDSGTVKLAFEKQAEAESKTEPPIEPETKPES
jgi:hypothetical protein